MILHEVGGEGDLGFEGGDGDFLWVEGFDEAVEFGGADGVGDFCAGGEVAFGVGVNVAGFFRWWSEDGFAGGGLEDGFWGFEVAEVVGAVEELVFPAGARTKFVVV